MGGGAAPHDIHHYKVNRNFAFVLCVWDQVFDTFTPVVTPAGPVALRRRED